MRVKNGHFQSNWISVLFLFSNFVSSGPLKKNVLGSLFCVLDEKLTKEIASHDPNPKFSVWHLLDLVNLDDLDLKYAHRKLRIVFRSVSNTIHVILLTFLLKKVVVRDETKHGNIVKHLYFDLTCDVIGNLEVNSCGSTTTTSLNKFSYRNRKPFAF